MIVETKDSFDRPLHGCINCPGATFPVHRAVECDAPVYTTADPTFMDGRDQDRPDDILYKQGTHPASDMIIDHHWDTPIAEHEVEIGEDLRKSLIQVIANDGSNIFIYPDNDPNADAIREFEVITNELIRGYLTTAYNISDADQVRIEARSFGNQQLYGNRTYPHYHHSFDGVLIYYLTAGNEYKLRGKDNYPIPLESTDRRNVPELNRSLLHRKGHEFSKEPESLDGSGNLILCDPRPAINYPYCNKAIAWKPKTGLLIMHPAYLWHESNTYIGDGVRISIVINYRVMTNENQSSVKPLASIHDI